MNPEADLCGSSTECLESRTPISASGSKLQSWCWPRSDQPTKEPGLSEGLTPQPSSSAVSSARLRSASPEAPRATTPALSSRYDNIKDLARNVDVLDQLATLDLEQITQDLEEATDFEGISVVAGEVAGWDPVNKVITVPTVAGEQGIQGEEGPEGPTGPTGPRGIPGLGEQGEVGPSGANGLNGYTPYFVFNYNDITGELSVDVTYSNHGGIPEEEW